MVERLEWKQIKHETGLCCLNSARFWRVGAAGLWPLAANQLAHNQPHQKPIATKANP
jgi:hypothetical protein